MLYAWCLTGVLALIGVQSGELASMQPNTSSTKLVPLNMTSGVYTPPEGAFTEKFSFMNPEPSVSFGGYLFGFEVISFENNYGMDPNSTIITTTGDGIKLLSSNLRWAGGQYKESGAILAEFHKTAEGYIQWQVNASLPNGKSIKSIKTIVRNLPRGNISYAATEFIDYADEELVAEYPLLTDGLATPLFAIRANNGTMWGISSLQKEVRPARFAFLPGPSGYKVELIHEQAGWNRTSEGSSCTWRIVGPVEDFKDIAEPHFNAVAENWDWESFDERKDAPEWMKDIALVLTLHGEHWTGFVHNDFGRQLEILKWVATKIDPSNVMIFLAGWDGRYYWSYPTYDVGNSTGGAAGFSKLIDEGHKLGYHFALMFGSVAVNPAMPIYKNISSGRIRDIYGEPYPGNYVDWDGDRSGDGSMAFMNLGMPVWRNYLKSRISANINKFNVDAYFLDICGLWENNVDGDMLLGMKQMVKELADEFPGKPPIGEMLIDAQMGFIPFNQVERFPLYKQANNKVVGSFRHLSWPAPGVGSTGIHENGFNQYEPVRLDETVIPTITFVYDTFTKHRDLVLKDIDTAKKRFHRIGNVTEIPTNCTSGLFC